MSRCIVSVCVFVNKPQIRQSALPQIWPLPDTVDSKHLLFKQLAVCAVLSVVE